MISVFHNIMVVRENVFPAGEGAFFIVPSAQYHKIVPFATLQ